MRGFAAASDSRLPNLATRNHDVSCGRKSGEVLQHAGRGKTPPYRRQNVNERAGRVFLAGQGRKREKSHSVGFDGAPGSKTETRIRSSELFDSPPKQRKSKIMQFVRSGFLPIRTARGACVPFGGVGVDSRRPQFGASGNRKISSERSPPGTFGRLGLSPNQGRNIGDERSEPTETRSPRVRG